MIEYFPAPRSGGDLLGVGYSLRCDAEGLRTRLPALGAQVQMVLAGGFRHLRGTSAEAVRPVVLVGPTSRAFDLEVEPSSWIVGCGIRPLGWASAIGAPADEAVDAVLDASAFWPEALIRRWIDQAGSCNSPMKAVAVLVDGILDRLAAVDTGRASRIALVEQWLGGPRASSLNALVAQLDLTHRQVARLTHQDFGCSPKQLQMKYRALRLAAAMALGGRRATTAAWVDQSEYFDQSHLTHDFSRFVGTTPQRYLAVDGAWSRSLIQARAAAGARRPTTLWS